MKLVLGCEHTQRRQVEPFCVYPSHFRRVVSLGEQPTIHWAIRLIRLRSEIVFGKLRVLNQVGFHAILVVLDLRESHNLSHFQPLEYESKLLVGDCLGNCRVKLWCTFSELSPHCFQQQLYFVHSQLNPLELQRLIQPLDPSRTRASPCQKLPMEALDALLCEIILAVNVHLAHDRIYRILIQELFPVLRRLKRIINHFVKVGAARINGTTMTLCTFSSSEHKLPDDSIIVSVPSPGFHHLHCSKRNQVAFSRAGERL
mmetsp:Transcript_59821/g.140857  ORF Transcript_59821/g.140857 Transcript_59821/m.140857 type:complete len:258 (+) Transcript_59821:1231-2004(+)